MDWLGGIIETCRSSAPYTYAAEHAEFIIIVAGILFFLFRGNVKASLVLALAGVLCYANYYVFSQNLYLTMPPVYAASFAGISALVLVLLVYQLIHSN